MPFPVVAFWITVGFLHFLPFIILSVEKINRKVKGKKFAVLGARQVGKTHLIEFLLNGTIPRVYKKTMTPVKTTRERILLRELNLLVKESWDVSGDTSARAVWKDLVAEADFVLYLLRADQVLAGNTDVEARVKSDVRHVSEWIEQYQTTDKPKRLLLVGTHCDYNPEYKSKYNSDMAEFVDTFVKLPTINELVLRGGGLKKVKVIAGSMRTIQETEVLVYQMLREVLA